MGELSFKLDLITGNYGEDRVVEWLVAHGAEEIEENHDNKYDRKLKYKNQIITYEIKTDVFCAPISDTGNMFIEFECRGKLSGIAVTEAKWFVTIYWFLNQIWFIETDKLKKLIKENNFPVTDNSGDVNSNTKGYLIKRKDFKKHFKIVCPITKYSQLN